jgi:glycosyltransferase involved in cell wall biosynthesis
MNTEKVLMFGGELSRRKGVDVLIDAWRVVAPDVPGWKLRLAGPAPASVAKQLESLDCAEYLGPVAHSELQSLLRGARVAVLPSRDEALPMFLLEAMASGCAIVATDVGSVRTIVDSANGVLIQPGSLDQLIEALKDTLGAPQSMLEEMCAASHQRAEALYSTEVVQQQLASMWRTAASTERTSRPASRKRTS